MDKHCHSTAPLLTGAWPCRSARPDAWLEAGTGFERRADVRRGRVEIACPVVDDSHLGKPMDMVSVHDFRYEALSAP